MTTDTATLAPAIRALSSVNDAHIWQLADVLVDCVEGGASVSFMLPLTRDRALGFWQRVGEGVARGERAKTLLVLDTSSAEAERLYGRLGWTRLGVIPGFALLPGGEPCDTTYFYRVLG